MGASKDDDDKDTPVSQASLEQLKDMLKGKKRRWAAASGDTLVQRRATKAQTPSEVPPRTKEFVPVA